MANDIILQPQPMPTTVVVPGEVVAAVDSLVEAMGAAPVIVDQPTLDQVRAIMVAASKLATTIDSQRSLAKGPWLAVCKAIDAAPKPLTTTLDQIKEECKRQIADFLTEQDRIRAEAEKARKVAEAAATASLAAGNAPTMAVTIQPQTIVAPTRKTYEFVVVDRSKIPDHYFDVAWDRVQFDWKDDKPIPGIERRERTSVVAR
jgi:hypothetical protein